MNASRFVTLASVASLALAALVMSATATAASQTSHAFVTYSVSLSSPSGEKSFVVNETLFPSSRQGYSNLMLQLIGAQQNLTYSRLVNSSINMLPYLPNLANQSLSYSNSTESYGVKLVFSNSATRTVSFQGHPYQMTTFSFAFTLKSANQTYSGEGSIAVFPSQLVYSLSSRVDGKYSLEANLMATNLPLSDPASENQQYVAYSAVGVSIGAVAIAVPLLMRRRKHSGKAEENKPLHWVD